MQRIRNIPWSRVLAEGAIIVVSILLAFAIDAWWDSRKDRHEEREILLGLRIEFVDLRERLDRWGEANRTGMRFIEKYLSDAISEMDLGAVETTFAYAIVVNVLDQGGAVDALLASGRLEKVGDMDIRGRLVKWPDWLEDIHTNDLSARSYAMHQIAPYLAKQGFPRTVCPGDQFIICSGSEAAPDEYIRLAEDAEFRAILINRRGWMRSIARDHERARDEADAILDLIEARLEALKD